MAEPGFPHSIESLCGCNKMQSLPEQAESLVGRKRVHAVMLTTQVHLQDINRTLTLREREDIVARVEQASAKGGVGIGLKK